MKKGRVGEQRLRPLTLLAEQPQLRFHFPRLKPRYLWTDAFGVVNLISLASETGERRYLAQVRALLSGLEVPLRSPVTLQE